MDRDDHSLAVNMVICSRAAIRLYRKDEDLDPNDLLWELDDGAARLTLATARAAARILKVRNSAALGPLSQNVQASLTKDDDERLEVMVPRLEEAGAPLIDFKTDL